VCTGPGGHGAVPPPSTTTERIARAIVRIHDNPPAPGFNDVTRELVRVLGDGATGDLARAAQLLDTDEARAVELFGGLNRDLFAMTRTTPVVTMASAGHSVNVVPERATAVVNTRVALGSSPREVHEYVRRTIDDAGIDIEVLEEFNPSPVSPPSGPMWERLVESIRAAFGDVVVAPYVNNGGTDARNYTGISDNVYRFNPYAMTLAERRALHAIDERMRIRSFLDGIRFYAHLIERL
jgi:carboxypeptidase PM20D1